MNGALETLAQAAARLVVDDGLEYGAAKRGGGDGFADVWKQGFFAWEYKGKHKDLEAAWRQLDEYRADLENPPLLVTSDLDRIEIHTDAISKGEKILLIDDLIATGGTAEAAATLIGKMGGEVAAPLGRQVLEGYFAGR